jgi:glyoxylase-like metal-dependent hydrolase (beta-lactamase superfamily II)
MAGDMVAGVGSIYIDPDEGNMSHYLDSLRLMIGRKPSALLAAHGPPIPHAKQHLEHYIKHRLAREDMILASLDKHEYRDIQAIVEQAYKTTPKVMWPLARRQALSHLNKLVQEGRVHALNKGWVTL